jgi:glucose-6-phosphate isomerase
MTWDRFKSLYYTNPRLGLALDISRMPFPDDFLATMQPKLQQAFADMAALEGGAIANPDEKRMVGHYWLRKPELAPNAELRAEIANTNARIKKFAADVHNGKIKVRQVTTLGLSFDHRIVDGKDAVTFLVRVKEALEDPARLVLDL